MPYFFVKEIYFSADSRRCDFEFWLELKLEFNMLKPMLKALVIATNSSTLKHNNYFKALNVDISYFVLEPHYKFHLSEYEAMKIYSEQMMLSVLPEKPVLLDHSEQRLQFKEVQAHIQQRQKLSPILLDLKNQLCPDPKAHIKTKPLTANYQLMNTEVQLVNDLKVSDFSNYQHILIENSDTVLGHLKKEFSSVFKVQHNDSSEDSIFQWMAFCYQSETSLSLENSFWFCENQNNRSIYDNCYFIEPEKKDLTIWAQVPIEFAQDDSFIRYFSDRILMRLRTEFHFLKNNNIQFKELGTDHVAFAQATRYRLKATQMTSLFEPLNLYSEIERSLIFTQLNADIYKKHKKYFKMSNNPKNTLNAGL